jgi:hypothetical protein
MPALAEACEERAKTLKPTKPPRAKKKPAVAADAELDSADAEVADLL